MKAGRIIVVVVAFLVAGVISFNQLKGTTTNSTEEQFSTVTVERGNIRELVESTGQVEANLEVAVKSKASGQITSVPVEFSDKVKKGDLLVQLDPIDEERSLKRAQVALNASKARHLQTIYTLKIARQNLITEERRARANLTSNEAQAAESIAKLKRAKELLDGQFLSQEEMDAAGSLNAKCQAALEAAHATMSELEATKIEISCKEQDIEIAAATVAEREIAFAEAQTRLKETRIVAPIDGVITASDAQIGSIVSSGISNVGGGSALMSIADLSRCFVEASVDESDIGKVRVGQGVVVTADAFPESKFEGRVVRVGAKGIILSNVVTFVVKIEVTGDGVNLLKPEMSSNVSIVTAEALDAIIVPALAITMRANKSFVKVINSNGSADTREVETGIGDLENTEILSGLKVGDKVCIEDASKVTRWRSDSSENSKDERRASHQKERMQAQMMGSKGPGR